MIAVANPTLTTVSPAQLPLRPQGTGRKMSFSCIAPQRSEIDGLDSSTTSEFGISECYQRAEKIFLGPQASSVAAALLEPGKRRNTSRFTSFRSPSKSFSNNAKQKAEEKPRRPLSFHDCGETFSLDLENLRSETAQVDKNKAGVRERIPLAENQNADAESRSIETNRRPSARFAVFSKKWRRHLMNKMSATKRSARMEKSSEVDVRGAEKWKTRKVDRKSSLTPKWLARSGSNRTESFAENVSLKQKLETLKENKCQLSLANVLRQTDLLNDFKRFLKTEYSDENLEFWEKIETYRKLEDHRKAAQTICSTYLLPNSPREINLSYQVKMFTLREAQDPSASSFDRAQKAILTLMESDSFRRYVASAR